MPDSWDRSNLQKKYPLAKWTASIPEGEIRRLLKYQVKYYFGGGLPGAMATPQLSTIIRDIGETLLKDALEGGTQALQMLNYTKTSGSDSLRKLLLSRLIERQHLPFDDVEQDFHKLMITTGSQQSIYGLLDVTINPGDYILSAAPSYLGFVTPAVKLGARVVLCPSDQDGMTIEGIEQATQAVKIASGHPPKMIYVVSDSDNPRGTTLPAERRRALFDIAGRESMLIVEDAAYKEIQFGKERIDPIKSLDTDNRIVAYLASTSKEAGVLRLGYAIFPEEIRENVEKAKGFYDLCTPLITQAIAERYYQLDLDKILKGVIETYRKRCAAMIEAVGQFFPEGVMTHPTGGFFVWWETNAGVSFDAKWFNENVAIPNQILFVPSVAFYPPLGWRVNASHRLVPFHPRSNGMRLSFSAVPPERIHDGIKRLGGLLRKHLQ